MGLLAAATQHRRRTACTGCLSCHPAMAAGMPYPPGKMSRRFDPGRRCVANSRAMCATQGAAFRYAVRCTAGRLIADCPGLSLAGR